jgi:diacylglycerol kinase (ATP)
VRFGQKIPYELDGGARRACRELRIKVRPSTITICVPVKAMAGSAAAVGGEQA